jgi:hypothetical protein
VEARSGSSYKIIILSFPIVNTVFIYDGYLQDWHSVEIPDILPLEIKYVSISNRGIVYNGIFVG